MTDAAGERIARRLSRAGVCSRREAERWIAAGRVAVDGRTVSGLGTLVAVASEIRVDGELVAPPAPTRLWRHHKPPGVVCSNSRGDGPPTLFDRLPPGLPRVMTVGRLDVASEGLLLLTNDGALARRLELPANGWARTYRARLFGRPADADLAALARGISIGGRGYGPIEVSVEGGGGANVWATVTLREGRNREIRRVLGHLGCPVGRLIRTAFGPFRLGGLPRGAVAEVPRRTLRRELGIRRADRGGPA